MLEQTPEKFIILSEASYLALKDSQTIPLPSRSLEIPTKQQQWLNNEEVMRLLNVSKSTLQTYRDKGLITFSQIGRKILYKSTDIETVLENFKVTSYKNLNKK